MLKVNPRSSKVIMGHFRSNCQHCFIVYLCILGRCERFEANFFFRHWHRMAAILNFRPFFLLHIYAFWDVANVLRQTFFSQLTSHGGHLELLAKKCYGIFTHFGTLRTFWGKLFSPLTSHGVCPSVRMSVCAHLLVNSIRAKPYELQWRNLVWSWSSTSSRSD